MMNYNIEVTYIDGHKDITPIPCALGGAKRIAKVLGETTNDVSSIYIISNHTGEVLYELEYEHYQIVKRYDPYG